jgi:hypothetical protein
LNEILPADATVVEKRSRIGPRLTATSIVSSQDISSRRDWRLGTGFGTALGVKCAVDQRPVILLIGDGSFNYNPVLAGARVLSGISDADYGRHSQQSGLSLRNGNPLYYPEGWSAKTNTFWGPRSRLSGLCGAGAGLWRSWREG